MKIKKIEHISQDEIIKKLKNVTMLKNRNLFIYNIAYISMIEVDPVVLFPCQYYILKSELDKKIELRESFLEYCGQDILSLHGGYEFQLENEPCIRTIIPPVIEESLEMDGKIYPLINDGMHRVYLAMILKSKIMVIYIRGSRKPYYAYPLPNQWADVKVVSEIKPNTIKKIHRITDNKKLYRNFDSVFTNCSAPRGLSKGYE